MNLGGSERITESVIDHLSAGIRLDCWLAARFTYHSRNQWQELIGNGKIIVNNRPCRNSRILRENDTVAYLAAAAAEPPVGLEYRIVYEDEYYYGIDKGGNLPCHPAGPYFKNTLWYVMRERFGEVFIVNRLDRETSGIMLAAKTAAAAAALAKVFIAGKATKKYLAMVHGIFDRPITADGFLIPDPDSEVKKKRLFRFALPDGFTEAAETAKTRLKPIIPSNQEVSKNENDFENYRAPESPDNRKETLPPRLTLVEAQPTTGRLHQIRATLCSLGFPLVGDKLYGLDDRFYLKFIRNELTPADRTRLLMERQALHALSLEFEHPFLKREISLRVPLPPDISSLLTTAI